MDSLRSSRSSSASDERQVLEAWTPEPLVPPVDRVAHKRLLNGRVVSSKAGRFITVDGHQCLNLATHNYLGLADNLRLEASSLEAATKYGVGSCGPRAFYGTMDVHLKLEEEIASFLGLQEAALYSFGFSAIASAIPAYAKANDVVFVDECCNFAIQQGLVAAKSKLIKFKHNNTQHLAQLMEELAESQRRRYGRTDKIRTFLIVEGIYAKTGQICCLPELIELKKKYKVRLFIDESRSFGVLGPHGKGVTQHFELDIQDVDLVMASLENALCAYGGFCAGSSYVVDHQRLAGAGYCFSASLPPLQTRVALESLYIIREEPALVKNAQQVFVYAHELFQKLSHLDNVSAPLSPIKLLRVRYSSHLSSEQQEQLLSSFCQKILTEEQVALQVASYIHKSEMTIPEPQIRLIVNGSFQQSDIDLIFDILERISKVIF